ncbi:hypothetical protein ACJX0J_005995, partial [Zea mays]
GSDQVTSKLHVCQLHLPHWSFDHLLEKLAVLCFLLPILFLILNLMALKK